MPTTERILELTALLSHTRRVGAGFWPSREAFGLGMSPDQNTYIGNALSSTFLLITLERVKHLAPERWSLIFFAATFAGKQEISQDDAIWLANHQAS